MAQNIILWPGAANPNNIILRDPSVTVQNLAPSGIASEEAFGTATVTTGAVVILPSGIPSEESFGTATIILQQFVSPSGIASAEAFGTATIIVEQFISPSGIASAEAFGTALIIIDQFISPSGITSEEAFGTAEVLTGPVYILPSGIPGEEAFGTAVVRNPYPIPPVTRDTIVLPCAVKTCETESDFSLYSLETAVPVPDLANCPVKECLYNPGDLTIYNLQDALIFNGTPLSVIAQCPTNYYCRPGLFPTTFTYPPGTFTVVVPPTQNGFPIVLTISGCESNLNTVLPAGATSAQIQAAADALIALAAAQQARCDAIEIAGPPLGRRITLSALSELTCLDVEFNETVYASASPSGAPYSIVSDNLPSWLTPLSTGTSLILTGTPTTAGAYTFTLYATGDGASGSKTYTLTVVGITTASPLPSGAVSSAYSETLTSSGLSGVVTWSIVAGTLPSGLSLNSATGEIYGTPTTVESSAFTISAGNGEISCEKSFTLEIAATSDCASLFSSIDWNFYGAPTVNAGCTGSWVGNAFNCSSTQPAQQPDCSSAQAQANGNCQNAGGALSCCLNITVTVTGGGTSISIFDFTTLTSLLSISELDLPAPGNYQFPFSVPAGANMIIGVECISFTDGSINPCSGGQGPMAWSGTFGNC